MRVRIAIVIVIVILATSSAVAIQALVAGDRSGTALDVLCMKSPRDAPDALSAQPHKPRMNPGRTPQWCHVPELADPGVDGAH